MDARHKPRNVYGRSAYMPYAPPPIPVPKPAEKPDPVSTDLEKELTCSICTSIYLHPVTLLDCLHSYCGACAKEWFTTQTTPSHPSAYPVPKGCPTCRQSVRAIKPSPHLAAITEMFLKHNPQHARDHEEITRLGKIYSPGDRIITDRSPGDSRNRSLSNISNRRAGDGWWDGLIDDVEENEEHFYAAISASLRDLIPRATTGLVSPTSSISVHTGSSSGGTGSDTMSNRRSSVLSTATLLAENPQVNCDTCETPHIQTNVHYHCSICQNDDFDICQSCFLDRKRCPGRHEMIARKYNADKHEMEKGIFCDTPTCRKNCNDMFWSCSACTTHTGTYKYCPDCVNNATSCNHDLVAFSTNPDILRRCGLAANRGMAHIQRATDLVQPAPVSVTTRCDLCSQPIAPSTTYFHCRACHGADWDCHAACLSLYLPRASDGIAKCLLHHPLQTLIQIQMPNAQNPTHFVRRALPSSNTVVDLKTQKRLAASVMGCGKRKIWLDPNEMSEISNANSRQTIRKLVADGLIIKKPVTMHSRSRTRALSEARAKGRHMGFGKRKGTKDARMPSQVLWMRRLRVLRRLLVKYRASGKIDKHLYHELYHLSKGNTFKHKRALVEHIHKAKAEKARERQIKEEMDIKRAKTKAARERRQQRVQEKRNALVADTPAE
ncbi:hypothetical protein H072_3687 [Dactylellina haptotyla CBS 200.50]|uniref:Ribosomal protein L19 n=1 Tax=Dactylellina haptotyla (strain CBS 200.50) TaxID=1284197 RepID=S8AH64_DACHA|nr:hypothetical protein H072_3687 [Dactylellina haptotyla CBS 200.50]